MIDDTGRARARARGRGRGRGRKVNDADWQIPGVSLTFTSTFSASPALSVSPRQQVCPACPACPARTILPIQQHCFQLQPPLTNTLTSYTVRGPRADPVF